MRVSSGLNAASSFTDEMNDPLLSSMLIANGQIQTEPDYEDRTKKNEKEEAS
jgi:hypothetical protein